MDKRFYYLHLWTSSELDQESKVIDPLTHPIKVDNIGLIFDDWYKDDLFETFPIFVCTERLKSLIQHFDFGKIKFTEVLRVSQGYNFRENYPNTEIGKFWRVEFEGICGENDFACWNSMYIVVSERALKFLRENNVIYCESDEIRNNNFEDYFNSNQKNFWM